MTTELFIQLVAIVLGSNWLGQLLIEWLKTKKRKKTPVEVILKALSRAHLLQSAERYHEQGYIDKDEYNDIIEEYKAYKALDGNGRVDREYGKGGALVNLEVR